MHKFFKVCITALGLSLFAGCASIPATIPFTAPVKADAKIGILLSENSKASANYTGSIGLLDLAIIATANSKLNKHLGELKFTSFDEMGTKIEAMLDEKGFDASVIETRLDNKTANKLKTHKDGTSLNDYSTYKQKYGLDYILVLRMEHIGTTRPYYAPVPTAPPTATATIWGELVNLQDKKVSWYRLTNTNLSIPTPWDEEGFPNLTNEVYSSLEKTIESIKHDLNTASTAAKPAITEPAAK
ncbi:MAG: hypothetical protein U5M23_15650 [Marinagarivorans sp.]|nr:hypothetical protein [Marinagarivorans sp.]